MMGLRSINNLKSPFEDIFSNTGSLNGPTYVKDGLLFYLDAGDSDSYPGSGTTWTDMISGNNNATIVDATYSSDDGGVIRYDGTNDWVVYPAAAHSLGEYFSVEVWAKWDESQYSPNNPFASGCLWSANANGDWGNSGHGILLGYGQIRYKNASNTEITDFTWTVPTTQVWHQIVFTKDSTDGIVYVDKSNENSSNDFKSSINSSSGAYGIGVADNLNGTYPYTGDTDVRGEWDGDISIVRIYNKVLSSSEIEQNYNANKERFGL
jgi:hypothetical protein